MNIVINGDLKPISHNSLNSVIAELGYQDAVIVTAVNGDFVAIGSRSEVTLQDGDKIEILAPMQGG
ncbi:sulfur carrier protein ThiS [Paraglaciecola sp.]|uniref:sulfur carrier protein ThiS n=1 Tax=Paraglaciecola sp. TaxID=1920173 RepID=UPI0030F4041D